MKCAHCGSDDIIAIQGQNYCLNCGYVVKDPAAAPVPGTTVSPIASETSAEPSFVAPAINEAPIAAPVAIPIPTQISPVVPVKSIAKAAKPKGARKAAAKKAPTRVGRAKAAPPANAATLRAEAYAQAAAAQASGSKARKKPVKPSPAVDQQKKKPHPLEFSFQVSVILGLLTGCAVGAALAFRADRDVLAYIGAASLTMAFIVVVLAQSALQYGLTRSQDGRPAPRKLWWQAARSSFIDVVNVQLVSLIGLTLLGIIAGFGWRISHDMIGGPGGAVFLAIFNGALIWGVLGVLTARRIAQLAVVVGGQSAFPALEVGWKLYLGAGGHLVAAGFESLLGAVLAMSTLIALTVLALAGLNSIGVSSSIVIVTAVAAGAIAFATSFVLLEIVSRIWLKQYRSLVPLLSTKHVPLMTGRIQSHKS